VEKSKSATNLITCGRVNPDIFLSDDIKNVTSLSPNNKPIWRHNAEGEQSKFPATIQPRPQGSLLSCAGNIGTPGQAQRHSGFEWLCKHNWLRPEPIRFLRLNSEHAQSDGKSVNRGLSELDLARGRDPRLLTKRIAASGNETGHYLALRRMLWRHFSAEEPWVLEWIRIPSDTCGRAKAIWIRSVWTEKFFNPERKSCGFENIRIRVDGASQLFSAYEFTPEFNAHRFINFQLIKPNYPI